MIFLIFVLIFDIFLVFVGFLKVLDVLFGMLSFSLDSGLVQIWMRFDRINSDMQPGKLRTDGWTIDSSEVGVGSDVARCINGLMAAQICHTLFFTWWRLGIDPTW